MAYPVQPVDFLDIGNALRTGADAGAQFQRAQLIREEDEQRKAAAQFIDPALRGDVTAMGRLIAGDPRAATAVGNTTTQMAARQKETRAEQLQFANDTIAGLDGAPEADRATVYAQRRAEAEARGWPVTMWPQQYSPSWHAIEKSRIIGVTEQWKAERARELKQLPGGGTAQPPPVPLPDGSGANAAPPGGGTSTASLREPIAAVVADARTVNPNLQLASAYRSQAVNTAAGGARDSQHMHGNAVDIPLSNLPPEQQQALVQRVLSDPRVNGFGYYPGTNSIHVDTRGGPRAAWGTDQTTRTVGQGWPAWMMPLVGQWQAGGRRADAGGPAITEDWGTGQRVPGGVQQASYAVGGGTPMPGQEPPVGAPQGVQRASYGDPSGVPAMRPENTVYNDGQGRAEPGGPVLGPQPDPTAGQVDPNIVQTQAQAPQAPAGAPAELDLARQINNQLKTTGSPARVATRSGRPTIKDDYIEVVYPGGHTGWVKLPPKKEEGDFGTGDRGKAKEHVARGMKPGPDAEAYRKTPQYLMSWQDLTGTREETVQIGNEKRTVMVPGLTGLPPPLNADGSIHPAAQRESKTIEVKVPEPVKKMQVEVDSGVSTINNYLKVLEKVKAAGISTLDTLFSNPQNPLAQELAGAFLNVQTNLRSEAYINTGVLQPAELAAMRADLLAPDSLRGALASVEAQRAKLEQVRWYLTNKLNVVRKVYGVPIPEEPKPEPSTKTDRPAELPRIGNDGAGYDQVPPGSQYLAPDGSVRIKGGK